MSTVLLATVLLAAGPGGSYAPWPDSPVEKATAAFRTGRELDQAVHAALRRWAKPAESETQSAAREFLTLYDELHRDTILSQATRDQLAAKLRPRLASLAKQIGRQAAAKAKQRSAEERPKSVDRGKDGDMLAQQAGGAGQPGRPGPAGGGNPPGTAQADDYGEELVELIQRTIAPPTWDRNGGPSSIRYWRPGRALVVSAPDDVHERIGGLLRDAQ